MFEVNRNQFPNLILEQRRLLLKIALGFAVSTLLKGSVGEPQSVESQKELALQNFEWYRKWIDEGRSVRLVVDEIAISELEKVRLVDLDLTQGLAPIDHSLQYQQPDVLIIHNNQGEQLISFAWNVIIGTWKVSVNRYLDLADVKNNPEKLNQQKTVRREYPNLLEDWSGKSIVTFSKIVGDYEITWSISNNGGQSNPLLQGGRVERGDYTLTISSKKSGEMIAAVGFAGRLIEPGLDVQHAFKNVGLHSLQSYTDQKTGVRMEFFDFGSLHPPGNFPLDNSNHEVKPLDEKELNVFITAILAFINSTITPQVAVITV